MVEVNWTKQALENIDGIAEYIAQDSSRYAEIFVEKVFERAEILSTHSQAGRVVLELQNKTIRELILGNYRIIYKIYEKYIDVLAVHHSSRKLTDSSFFNF